MLVGDDGEPLVLGGPIPVIRDYDGKEEDKDGVPEVGYLPCCAGDCVVYFPVASNGHAGNRFPLYVWAYNCSAPGTAPVVPLPNTDFRVTVRSWSDGGCLVGGWLPVVALFVTADPTGPLFGAGQARWTRLARHIRRILRIVRVGRLLGTGRVRFRDDFLEAD